ncbi:MAG: cysteine desulfurase [Sphingomonadaceae bacterium]|uniref:cysteine desulfurase family protein n=1 Tax=Thermaurantiacus sp. TaxID=2820283 RepID=UPI00298F295B|nr:cysteine desulfurase family protein [Thermaurantiacus sp.]MCS6986163.1 cysteine desulfurase [Sphingomonadaceae bacterium]MDW8414611.1 cysteine desulfurase family protein [Thermaurantiacus sp.]
MIDLDQQATTPLAPDALAAMLPWLRQGHWNPHSAHAGGRQARAAVEAARARIAQVLATDPARVVFTSGATEANNLALKGFFGAGARGRLLTFATEHSCVLEAARALARDGVDVTILAVRPDGLPDLDRYAAELARGDVALVSAMRVNNEVGAIWPVAAMAQAAHRAGARFHTDAAQAFGKIGCRLIEDLGDADLVSVSAHKIYGPKGVGALVVAPDLKLRPLLDGGGQERFRSGTQSPALAAGFGAAATLAMQRLEADQAHARALQARALELLRASGVAFEVNGPPPDGPDRLPTNLSLRFPGVPATRLIPQLRDVLVSSGAACSSGAGRPSHVLAALGLSREAVAETIRVGFGRYTTPDEIDRGFSAIAKTVMRMQSAAR